jgi:hypothetical protein
VPAPHLKPTLPSATTPTLAWATHVNTLARLHDSASNLIKIARTLLRRGSLVEDNGIAISPQAPEDKDQSLPKVPSIPLVGCFLRPQGISSVLGSVLGSAASLAYADAGAHHPILLSPTRSREASAGEFRPPDHRKETLCMDMDVTVFL